MVYRELAAESHAEADFTQFLDELFNGLTDGRRDPNDVVRETLTQIYFANQALDDLPLAARVLSHSFDPRNVTTEPEYYSEIDTAAYLDRKPAIWFWQMFDRSPLGGNALLGHRLRRMLAPLIFKNVGANFKCWQHVEWSFGYNLSFGDNVVVHRHVLLDDRGGIEIGSNVSISDYVNIYSHSHDLDDIKKVSNMVTRIGDGARITYHASVLAGVQIGEHAILGTGSIATRKIEPHHIGIGLPAKTVKVKGGQPSDDVTPPQKLIPTQEYVALALIGDQIKVVSLSLDGEYRFLDQRNQSFDFLYVSANVSRIEEAIEELEWLVNNPKAKEKDFQDFFARNKDFILNDEYKDAHPHLVFANDQGNELIPDFVLEPVDQSTLCDLLELKLPSAQTFVLKKNRMRYSAAVAEACAQLREYGRFFEEEKNRRAVLENYGLTAYKPKMFVIIGRKSDVDPLEQRSIQTDMPNLQLRTYDDIINRMKWRTENIKSGNVRK